MNSRVITSITHSIGIRLLCMVDLNIKGILPSSMLIGYLFVFIGMGVITAAPENPNVTVRFANPRYDCETLEYCLDVEFQSDQEETELFGMNVRFFYDEDFLELINFRNYEGGYGPVTPNPATNVNTGTGIPWFNFTTTADYINGAIQKVNGSAPAIYMSTTGWTKLYEVCFTVDSPPDLENFCPPVVWDLESNPSQGGFTPGAGVVMTVYNDNGGSANALEHVEQFNWQYSGDGGAPYGEPIEVHCLNADCGNTCSLIVTSASDSGTGTLREKIECANPGDTITFASGMAGQTILINSTTMTIDKNLYIRSNLSNRVKIKSQIPGLFVVQAGSTVEFKDIDITSGLSIPNNNGAAIHNKGTLRLINMKIFKNPSLPNGQYLIRNKPGSQCTLMGNCYIEIP